MKKNTYSEQDRKQLREKAKKELERLEKEFSNPATVQLLDTFKNKFNICESVYKVILKEHQKSRKKKADNSPKITMNQVPSALTFAGYSFDKALLNEIFGSKSISGKTKTVKKLRDAVTHGIDEKVVQEIVQRKEELFGYMDKFLDTIKNFDSEAA